MILKCELCNLEMKTRINGSHLMRSHNITLDQYKKQFPNAIIGKRTPKIQKYICKICNKEVGSVQRFSSHLQTHNTCPEQYFIKYIINGNVPLCKCGCKQSPSFISLQRGYHEYIIHHAPMWNKGLTKNSDDRVNHMYDNRKTWNKGLTKDNNKKIEIISNKIKKSWNVENLKQRSNSYKTNMLKKYGAINGFQLVSVKEKIKETMLLKFGAEHPQFCNDIKFKWKTYIFPSGKKCKYQGYENFGIDLLLKTYNEGDIITDRKIIPKIKYKDFDGKIKRYCPDIWIPKENLLVEIKSNYTYNLHTQNIIHKRLGVISNGYNFNLFVFNNDGTLNNKINDKQSSQYIC